MNKPRINKKLAKFVNNKLQILNNEARTTKNVRNSLAVAIEWRHYSEKYTTEISYRNKNCKYQTKSDITFLHFYNIIYHLFNYKL